MGKQQPAAQVSQVSSGRESSGKTPELSAGERPLVSGDGGPVTAAFPAGKGGAGPADSGSSCDRENCYSYFVRMAKVLLPAVAVVLLVLIILWPQFHGVNEDSFNVGFARQAIGEQSQRLVNARYFSSDDDRQPYSITADLAEETAPGSRIVRLTHPQADITGKDGAWMIASAREGLFAQEKNTLTLNGDVSLFHDKGYELHTESASFDIHSSTAWGDQEIRGKGGFGELSGQGFRITDHGHTISLTGKSRVLLRPAARPASEPVVAPAAPAKGGKGGKDGQGTRKHNEQKKTTATRAGQHDPAGSTGVPAETRPAP